jgi:diguanylate cyclase (GGDEF)-like protein
MRFGDVIHPDDLDRSREVFAGGAGSVRDYEIRCVRGDGETVWIAATMSVVEGSPAFAITQVQDVTERKATEADLVRRASRDPLTGLANRDAFTEPLEAAIRLARTSQQISALLFCDLDDFKIVNDTLGHDAGDAVLVAVAQRLVSLVRPTDTVARLGGDEFVVLTGNVSVADLGALVDRLERSVAAPVTYQGHIMRVRVSVGVAVIDDTVDDAGSALRAADRAMYLVKGTRHGGEVTRRVTAFGDRPGAPGGMPLLRLARPETAQ